MKKGGSVAFLACLALVAPAHGMAAAPGSLDRLTEGFVARLEARLDGVPRAQRQRADLALALVAGKEVSAGLKSVLQRLLLARLRRTGVASVQVAPSVDVGQAARWARRAGFELLIWAELFLDKGQLQLRGELQDVAASLWRDMLARRRGSLAHLYARVRADAEVRSYLGASGRVRLRFGLKRQRLGRGAALALAVADLDRDGRSELAVLRPAALELWRLSAGLWRRVQRIKLAGPLATVAPRRAMGTLLAADLDGDGRKELYFRSSQQASGATLTWKGQAKLGPTLQGYPAAVVGGVRVEVQGAEGMDFFTAKDLRWPQGIGAKALPQRFYAFQLTQLTRKGVAERVAAATDTDGALHLLDGALDREIVRLAGVGAAFSLVDADDDGRLEVMVSAPDETGREERVRIFRLDGDKLRPLWKSALLTGRLTAFGQGDVDGDGQRELLAATVDAEGRCWLYQLD